MWVILNDAYAVYILFNHHKNKDKGREEGRRKKEEGRRKKEEGRRKKEEGRRKKEEAS
jgi:hypothetical protein